MVLHLNKLECPLPKNALCQFGWNRSSGSGEEHFKKLYFCYLPLNKGGALHLNKPWSSLPKDSLYQVWLIFILPSGSGEVFLYINFVNVFLQFRYYLPLEKSRDLLLNKIKFPTPKDALCQVWLYLTQYFWRRGFFNFVNVFSLFRNY